MPDRTNSAEPFANDIDYIEAEAAVVVAKSARIEAEHLDEVREDRRRDTIGDKPSTANKERERKAVILKESEDRKRADLDARIEATKAAGKVLGIDALCVQYHLGAVERTTVLLSVMAALDEYLESAMGKTAPGTFCARLSPEIVWAYMQLTFAQRIEEGRQAFVATSPLLKNGLITLTMGRDATPYDLRSAGIGITQAAFDAVLGLTIRQAKPNDAEACS